MGFGRDLRSAIFHHVTGFSAAETARFGAPSLLTRTTNDVQQIQLLVQLTCTMLITAPIMSHRRHLHGGAPGRRAVVAAAGQRSGAGDRQLLDRLAPAADLPQHAAAHRRHQPRDARTAVRHPGDPRIRAGAVRAQPIRRGEPGAVGHRADRGPLAGADAAGDHAGDQRLQRRADLVRRPADRRRSDAGGLADRVPVLLHADPDGGAAGDVHPGHAAAGVGVRRTHHRGAVHRAGDHQPGQPRPPVDSRRCDQPARRHVQLPRRRSSCAAGCFADRASRAPPPRSSAPPGRASRRWCR